MFYFYLNNKPVFMPMYSKIAIQKHLSKYLKPVFRFGYTDYVVYVHGYWCILVILFS